jgi:hypothetical membrane protein
MNPNPEGIAMSTLSSTAIAPDVATRTPGLLAGIVAGPLFVATATAQILTRDGFDLARHPLSLLANGEHGWVQIANFIVAGLLSLAFAWALAPRLRGGRGEIWIPRLLALFGVGLVIGGVFPADPALGFPAGAPAGVPEQISIPGLIHAFAPPLAFLSLIGACLIMASRYARHSDPAAAVGTRIVAVTCLVLTLPVGPLFSVRLFVAVIIGFAWIAVVATRALADSRSSGIAR